jgi:uncharacterized membrane protein YidH (DUF202 family)
MIGFSLFAIACGAILKYAVNAQVTDVDLSTIGLILIVVGGIGLLLGVWMYLDKDPDRWRRWLRQ